MNNVYWYAEIADRDVGEARLTRARKVVAWAAHELGIRATLSTLRWFVPQTRDDVRVKGSQATTWAWSNLERVSIFSHDARLLGRCMSRDEIWVAWGQWESDQDETICHELAHMALKQSGTHTNAAAEEAFVTEHGKAMAARIDWARAEADYLDWLVDPDRWAPMVEPKAAAKAAATKVPALVKRTTGVKSDPDKGAELEERSRPTAAKRGAGSRRAQAQVSPTMASAMDGWRAAHAALQTASAARPCGMKCASLQARIRAKKGQPVACCSGTGKPCADSQKHLEAIAFAEGNMERTWQTQMSSSVMAQVRARARAAGR